MEPAIIGNCPIKPQAVLTEYPARNVLLFSLLFDDDPESASSQHDLLWDVFHAFFIDASTVDLIRQQAEKLIHISQSIETWTCSKYGNHLKLINDETREILRHVWRKMCDPPKLTITFNELKTHYANHKCEPCHKDNVFLDFGQACGPKSYFAGSIWKDIPSPTSTYFLWNHGIVDPPQGSSGTVNYNPLLAYSQLYGDNFRKHQDVSPFYGFHLASSISGPLEKHNLLPPAAEAAKLQFREWITAFRKMLLHNIGRDNLRIRFIVCEAISFAAGLERLGTGRGVGNVYSRPWSSEPLRIGDGDSIPTAFNVIETGYAIDRVGFLNLAPYVIPLLKPPPAVSVLYTCTNKTFPDRELHLLKTLLCGDVGIMCTLLGIVPIAYTSGTTTRGHMQDNPQSTHPLRRIDNRITWKLTTSDSSTANVAHSRPHFEAGQLSKFLFDNLYRGMFPYESLKTHLTNHLRPLSSYGTMFYTKNSFTLLLNFLEHRVHNGTLGPDWRFSHDKTARYDLK